MTSPSTFVKFLLSFIFGVVGASALCFAFVDKFVVPDNQIAQISYKNMLLERVPSPRIIIDSGSNSLWSIVPEMIEAAFNRPAFVVADWAGIPLEMRLARLHKYAVAGDTIILPLEWHYYSDHGFSEELLERVLGIAKLSEDQVKNVSINSASNYAAYYHTLGLLDRAKFVLAHVNLVHIKAKFAQLNKQPHYAMQIGMRLAMMEQAFRRNVAGDSKDDSNRDRAPVGHKSCGQYLQAKRLETSEYLQKAAEELSAFQRDRGVRILVTWPAVAGKDCYDPTEAAALATQVHSTLENAGIQLIGDPVPAAFSDDHVLDTYYHVDSVAARVRTEKLVQELRASGVFNGGPEAALPLPAVAAEALVAEKARMEGEIVGTLAPIETGEYALSKGELFKHFFFPPDVWGAPEGQSIKAHGDQSVVLLRAPEKDCVIKLVGTNFSSDAYMLIERGAEQRDRRVTLGERKGVRVVTLSLNSAADMKALTEEDGDPNEAAALKRIDVDCSPLASERVIETQASALKR